MYCAIASPGDSKAAHYRVSWRDIKPSTRFDCRCRHDAGFSEEPRAMSVPVYVYKGDALARYGFGADHPFGQDRHAAFHDELARAGLDGAIEYRVPVGCSRDLLELFHAPEYVDFVAGMSAEGHGFLDHGDTPAVPGCFEAASVVVGTTVAAVDAVMSGECRSAFVPIAGLHHAGRDRAAGFCVFNDCGVAIEHLKNRHRLNRIAYVDIDAHHGDGVYYAFEADGAVVFADIHEDGRYMYPGTGSANEVGTGEGRDLKLNIPMPPGAGDAAFLDAWPAVEALLQRTQPEFILLQCGADSLAGDPLTHLRFSENAHAHAAQRLRALAEVYCSGRIVATGGGGYNRHNLARAWTRVVEALAA
jgi:acetoin utilization protein AcuC